jgi:hypothetical protein
MRNGRVKAALRPHAACSGSAPPCQVRNRLAKGYRLPAPTHEPRRPAFHCSQKVACFAYGPERCRADCRLDRGSERYLRIRWIVPFPRMGARFRLSLGGEAGLEIVETVATTLGTYSRVTMNQNRQRSVPDPPPGVTDTLTVGTDCCPQLTTPGARGSGATPGSLSAP